MRGIALLIMAGILATCPVFLSGCGNGETTNGKGEDVLAGMTLEEKVGQLFMIGIQGTGLTPDTEEELRVINPGGVILFGRNIEDEDQLIALTGDLQEVARNDTGIPLFISTDQEGGRITRVKWLDDAVPEAEIDDTEHAYGIGLERGQDLLALGINHNLAPVLDACQPDDFLMQYQRCFPGSPEEAGELGKSVISGQRDGGVLSTAKHFPGYGGVVFDPENERIPTVAGIPEISQFEVAAEAEPEFVMTANVIYEELSPDTPFTLTTAGIEYLRDRVKGDYLVITDDLASTVLKAEYGMGKTVVMAVEAGNDILLVSANQPEDSMAAYNALLEAVRNGDIAEEVIDLRVKRILHLKERLGQDAFGDTTTSRSPSCLSLQSTSLG